MWIQSRILLLCFAAASAIEYEKYHRPQIIRGPGVKKVLAGKSAKYECEAFGNPAPTLTWQFNDTTIEENEWYQLTFANSITTLRIKDVDAALEGVYCCMADDGHYVASYCGRLRVKRAPTITKHPLSQSIEVGAYTIFQCGVDAFPKATVSWSHNGKVIDCIKNLYDSCGSYVLTYSNALRIIDAKLSDKGWYSCSAANDFGRSESQLAYLTVTGSVKVTLADETQHNRKEIMSESVSTGFVLTSQVMTLPLTERTTLPAVTTSALTTTATPTTTTKIPPDESRTSISTTGSLETTAFSSTLEHDGMTTFGKHTTTTYPETDADGSFSTPPVSTPGVSTMDSPTVIPETDSTLPAFHSREEAKKISDSVLDNLYHVSSLDHESPNNTVITASFVGTCLVLCTAGFLCWAARKKRRLDRHSTTIMKCHRS